MIGLVIAILILGAFLVPSITTSIEEKYKAEGREEGRILGLNQGRLLTLSAIYQYIDEEGYADLSLNGRTLRVVKAGVSTG